MRGTSELIWLALVATAPGQSGDWWAYRELVEPEVPPVARSAWVHHPIDAFVLAKLEAAGLSPAEPADKVALLRRATYDLTGLPPTPDDVAAFLADDSPAAFERVVERLLASEQYGLKWGRHWLDLVRYAETDSYERDRRKPSAWRYRDYVIDAFNADKPYDRFLLEQLAGDELDEPTLETITATAYYRLGIWDDEPTDTMQAVYDDYDGIVDTTARVMLGVSMGCARCHDHKKDPIPQRDYYRMLSFFEGIRPYKVGGGNAITTRNFVRNVETPASRRDLPARLESWRRERQERIAEVQNLAREVRGHLGRHELARLDRGGLDGIVTRLAFSSGNAVGGRDDRHAGALRFDGDDDHVTIARPVQDDFTISFWFKTDRPDRSRDGGARWFTGSGFVDGEIPGIVDDFGVSLVGDRVAAGVGRPETFVSSGGGYADGAWHHVAFTRVRETGEIALFVDGAVADRAKGGKQALTSPETLTIGRMRPGRGALHGEMDDVRIYDRALSVGEVLALAFGEGFEAGTDRHIEERLGRPEAERYRAAIEALAEFEKPTRELVRVLCVREQRRIEPSYVRVRGNVHAKGEAVVPGFPAIVGGDDAVIEPRATTSGRRLAFARWVTAHDNPLTWRVAVNRIWQHHFGRGIARTPNDFGRLGQQPTHPELLDWLATTFVDSGFSFKAMHRLIMSSNAYRMSSRHNDATAEADPLNDLFSRFDMRRLTAEEIRDSILAVSGNLNLQTGGPSVYPPMPPEFLHTASRPGQAWGKSPPDQASRRSIYIHAKRSLLTPMLTAFDLADTDTTCPVRFVTTQPTQALTMLNSDWLNQQARIFADRLRGESDDQREQVASGLRLVTCREPSTRAIDRGIALMDSLTATEGFTPARALESFCLVLLNLNEFVYLD